MTSPGSHPEVEDCLFHYTSAGGLKGILEDGCIWATDSAFLNDSSEISYAAKEVATHIKNLIQGMEITNPGHASHDWYRLGHLKAVLEVLEKYNEAEDWAPTTLPPHAIDGATYVSCFTENPDQLSQWRGYGGRGYSIGFTRDSLDINNLTIDGAPPGLFPSPVTEITYGRPGLEKVLQAVTEWLMTRPIPVIPTEVHLVDAFGHILPRFAEVKHEAFKEEQEWRVTVPSYGHGPASNLHFREGIRLVPYLKLRFDPSAIAFVYIGPGGDFNDKRALRAFLAASGYDLDRVWIEHSSAPFRGS